jgi:hypothetical protein
VELQSLLTLMIEVIFWAFITLMISNFINRLWVVPLPPVASKQPNLISQSTASALAPQFEDIPDFEQHKSQPKHFIAPQFESIPDPWTLEPESPQSTVETQTVVLTAVTLKLLPPVQEVQPKFKRAKASKLNKSFDPKSPSLPRKHASKVA